MVSLVSVCPVTDNVPRKNSRPPMPPLFRCSQFFISDVFATGEEHDEDVRPSGGTSHFVGPFQSRTWVRNLCQSSLSTIDFEDCMVDNSSVKKGVCVNVGQVGNAISVGVRVAKVAVNSSWKWKQMDHCFLGRAFWAIRAISQLESPCNI